MNTENKKNNESHKFRLKLADKVNLKVLIKIWHWLISVSIIYGKH